MPEVALGEMFDDAFNAIARDGASSVQVATWLQKALQSLALLGHHEMRLAAESHSILGMQHAERALQLPREVEAVCAAAEHRPAQ